MGIGGIGWWEVVEVKCEDQGVKLHRVEGVLKVHEKGGTLPTEIILDEGVKDFSKME